jgi:hypothetical protein
MTAGLTWIMTTKADYLPSLYRHVTVVVCQADLGVGAVCATSFSQRHLPIGTMALRAIVREQHLS